MCLWNIFYESPHIFFLLIFAFFAHPDLFCVEFHHICTFETFTKNKISISSLYLFLLILFLGSSVHCGSGTLESAIHSGKTNLVVRLLDAETTHPNSLNNALLQALRQEKFEIVALILKSGRVNPAVGDNKAIRWASKYGHLNVVELLLKDPRVDPAVSDNYAFRWASSYGHVNIVNALLQDPRVNPAAQDNAAIRWASKYGHLNVVEALLKDPRVDPSARHNEAILFASQNGHASVIEALLEDKRLDPSVEFNEVLLNTVKYKDIKIVKQLLLHKNVNPADNNNAVMRFFIENRPVIDRLKERQDIFQLLLEDGRADPTVSNNEIFNQVKKYTTSPFKLLLEKDTRVKSIDYLNTAATPLNGNAFLDLFKSEAQLNTPSYIENIFSERKNHLVSSFLADFLKIPFKEASKIHNLDDLDKYVMKLYIHIYQLPQEYKEFVWRYYSFRPDYENRFQDLTIDLVKNGLEFRKDVIPKKISNPGRKQEGKKKVSKAFIPE